MSDLRDAPSQLFLTCYPTKADLSWFAAELERDPVARAKTPDMRKRGCSGRCTTQEGLQLCTNR